MSKSYVMFNGNKYFFICDAVDAASETDEEITVRIFDCNGNYEDKTFERNWKSGDIVYTAYSVADADGNSYAEEINTKEEALALAREIGGTAFKTKQTLYEVIEGEPCYV